MQKPNPQHPLGGAPLSELQALWDGGAQRVDRIVGTPEAQPLSLAEQRAASRSRRERVWALVLAAACVAALVVAALLYRRLAIDLILQATLIGLMALYAAVALAVAVPIARRRKRGTDVALRRVAPRPLPQAALFGAAAIVALAFVATQPVGDGYAMTQNYHGRADAVATVNQMLSVV